MTVFHATQVTMENQLALLCLHAQVNAHLAIFAPAKQLFRVHFVIQVLYAEKELSVQRALLLKSLVKLAHTNLIKVKRHALTVLLDFTASKVILKMQRLTGLSFVKRVTIVKVKLHLEVELSVNREHINLKKGIGNV